MGRDKLNYPCRPGRFIGTHSCRGVWRSVVQSTTVEGVGRRLFCTVQATVRALDGGDGLDALQFVPIWILVPSERVDSFIGPPCFMNI